MLSPRRHSGTGYEESPTPGSPNHLVGAQHGIGSGIVVPSALAVLRFTVSTHWVDCSIGNSAGLAPSTILSTYSAARRNIIAVFGAIRHRFTRFDEARQAGLGYFVHKSKHMSLDLFVPCLHLAWHA